MTRPSPTRSSNSPHRHERARPTSARPPVAPAPNAARRAARRRQEFGQRVRRIEASLPGLGFENVRPALPNFSTVGAFRFSGFAWSKLASGALLASIVACLVWLQLDPRWYVYREHVQVRGQVLVDAASLIEAAQVEGWNLFWLRHEDVQERILKHPWVSEATVALTLPAGVRIQIEEKPTIGLWVTDAGQYLISPTGSALPLTSDAPANMPRLIDPAQDAAVPGSESGTAVDTTIVASALALIARLPGVSEVRYSPEIGLNFGLPGSPLYIYWGDGEHVDAKLEQIALSRRLVETGEIPGAILDVRFPERPFLR